MPLLGQAQHFIQTRTERTEAQRRSERFDRLLPRASDRTSDRILISCENQQNNAMEKLELSFEIFLGIQGKRKHLFRRIIR